MANIMINQVCNLRCPYCFANEFVNEENIKDHKSIHNMSLHDFQTAVNFILTNSDERIGIIGGEPTLHPNFKEMMEMLIFDSRVKSIILFTNGTYLEKYYKLLTNSKISILINCNSPNDIGENQFRKLENNLDVLINQYYMKDKITLGINMYKENFEYDYIVRLLNKYKYDHVRTSIAVPNTDEKKEISALNYFRTMKKSVFNFFRELEKIQVMPTYDCNLMPTCILSYEETEWLKGFWKFEKPGKMHCNIIDCSQCSPVIDILPDLNAVRCFGLSDEHKVHINRFQNLKEIRNYFYNRFDVYSYNIKSTPECDICELNDKMLCMGGCLAFKVNKINKARNFCSNL